MNVLTQTKLEHFLANFQLDLTNAIQKEAYEALGKLDFPTTRQEYWKYTRLNKIANSQLVTSQPSAKNLFLEDSIIAENYLVIENGIFRADISSFDLAQVNIAIESADKLTETTANFNEIFQALNTAFAEQTVHVSIPKNVVWEQPVQVIYIHSKNEAMSNTRLVIDAGESSKANIITTFVGEEVKVGFSNHLTEIKVGENANLTIDKIQAGNGWYIATENVAQQANSTFKINTITLAGDIVRNNLNIEVEGQNCDTFLNGAVITKENQLVDNHTFVNHQVSNCMSDENYKYVLDGKSIGVFNGRVVVKKDAQKINAYQQNGNVLLSDFAKINSKPELEIYADDVKCSHGSTTGQLDEDALFYLQTRGVSKPKAKKILVAAFTGEILNSIDNERLKYLVFTELEERFGWSMI